MSSFEGAFQEWWHLLLDNAVSENLIGNGFDKPLAELLRAIEPTDLGRFMPFTSMCQLCLATSNYPWEEVKPACVEFWPDGRFPFRYRVIRRSPYPAGTEKEVVTLETNDPVAATDELVRLVLGTPD